MKRILHLVDHLWLGWAQVIIKEICEWDTCNMHMVYSLKNTDNNISIDSKNVFFASSWSKFSLPLKHVLSTIKKHQIEILHCHLVKAFFIGCIIKTFFFKNIKLIIHEHGPIFTNSPLYRLYRIGIWIFFKKVDLFIAVSKETERQLLQKTPIPKEKIQVVYNFVNTTMFSPLENKQKEQERKKFWFEEKDILIGCAGRIDSSKWWETFVKASILLMDRNPLYKFCIAWEGPEKEKLLKLISPYTSSIVYLGKIPYKRMVHFYNMIDVFVIPSYVESLWLVWLEANACGCPVVASNIPWLNEIMHDSYNCLLFEVKNEKDLASKIEYLLHTPHMKATLIKNWRAYIQKFTKEVYITWLQALYETL